MYSRHKPKVALTVGCRDATCKLIAPLAVDPWAGCDAACKPNYLQQRPALWTPLLAAMLPASESKCTGPSKTDMSNLACAALNCWSKSLRQTPMAAVRKNKRARCCAISTFASQLLRVGLASESATTCGDGMHPVGSFRTKPSPCKKHQPACKAAHAKIDWPAIVCFATLELMLASIAVARPTRHFANSVPTIWPMQRPAPQV